MINSKLSNIRISVVCPWFFRGDAVGHSAHDYYRAFCELGYSNVRGIGTRNDFPDMSFESCMDLKELEANVWFNESDLIVYHYAIYHELFDVLKKNGKKGRHVVCFHNVTPKHLTPESVWDIIDKSFEQLQLFKNADAIWVDSRENAEELIRQGVNNLPFVEIPIAVDRPEIVSYLDKPKRQIELLYVGRFFPSKGILDIIDAIAIVQQQTSWRFVLRLAGNTDFSDPNYILEVKERICLHGLGEYIEFVGKVDELSLARVFRCSHILVSASYHEGFCVPVIEALRAGMIPVTYDAGNLRWIASGNGRIVETGNIQAFADALTETINGVAESFLSASTPTLVLDKGIKSASQFATEAKEYACGFRFENFAKRLDKEVADAFIAVL